MRVYGPYIRKKDGRKHVILYNDGKRRTMSYPKWLMQQHLGRELLPNETVHHIDEDFTNDSLDNLQVLTRLDHMQLHIKEKELYEFTCPVCNIPAVKSAAQVRHNRKLGKAGPFCSRACAGTWSTGRS